MTREEAIKRFENQLKGAIAVLDSGFGTRQGESDRLYRERKEMAQFALAALWEQEKRENEKPLTLDELYAVRNREPILVYAVCLDDETKQPDFDLGEWQIFDGYVFYNDETRDDLSNYGKRFLAYRHRPEV